MVLHRGDLEEAYAGPWELDVEEGCGYLRRLGDYLRSDEAKAQRAIPMPVGMHLVGGEPFARSGDLERLLGCAVENGIAADVTTTGSWVDKATVRDVLGRFVGKVVMMTVRTSRAQLDQGGLDRLVWLMDAARDLDIQIALQCVVGPSSPFPRELLALEAVNCDNSYIQAVPHASFRNGEDAPGFSLDEPPPRRCADLLGFMIAPGGEVYPCAGGLGIPALSLGSLKTEGVAEIIGRAIESDRLWRLREVGPRPLFDAVRASPARGRLRSGYLNACHFHHHALTDPEMNGVVAAAEAAMPPTVRPVGRSSGVAGVPAPQPAASPAGRLRLPVIGG